MATLFGDTSGTLSRSQKGKHQVLIGTDDEDNFLFGDAGVSIIDFARGGNDTLTGGDNNGPRLLTSTSFSATRSDGPISPRAATTP